jgi:hypothetical protein
MIGIIVVLLKCEAIVKHEEFIGPSTIAIEQLLSCFVLGVSCSKHEEGVRAIVSEPSVLCLKVSLALSFKSLHLLLLKLS